MPMRLSNSRACSEKGGVRVSVDTGMHGDVHRWDAQGAALHPTRRWKDGVFFFYFVGEDTVGAIDGRESVEGETVVIAAVGVQDHRRGMMFHSIAVDWAATDRGSCADGVTAERCRLHGILVATVAAATVASVSCWSGASHRGSRKAHAIIATTATAGCSATSTTRRCMRAFIGVVAWAAATDNDL